MYSSKVQTQIYAENKLCYFAISVTCLLFKLKLLLHIYEFEYKQHEKEGKGVF